MTHRSDRIRLPANEPRCDPTETCVCRSSCARYLAAIPQGTPLGDFSHEACGGTVQCPGFVSQASLFAQHNPRPTKTHPPMGGGS